MRIYPDDDGSLYVTDCYNAKIYRVQPDKTLSVVTEVMQGSQSPPCLVRLLKDGDHWLLSTTNGIYRFSAAWEGQRLTWSSRVDDMTRLPDGTVVFVNCGHPCPLLVRAGESNGTLAAFADPAPPLGLSPTPTAARMTMHPGDRLLFYTDGLIEAQTRVARGIDVEMFAPIVAKGSLEQSISGILRALAGMVDGRLEDDLALVLAEFDPR